MIIPIRHAEPHTQGARTFLAETSKTMLIGGDWQPGAKGEFPTRDPATGAVLAQIARGDAGDVSRAVAAAREALERGPWGRITPMERARIL